MGALLWGRLAPAAVRVGFGRAWRVQEQLERTVPSPLRIRMVDPVPYDPPRWLAHDLLPGGGMPQEQNPVGPHVGGKG